ncbi:2Fe-2S iron-sulfur cluster-binding protein [Alicyclobacillus fastidiosus]|uniref:2Fe-2S iron-sulfur cluster binding domain-containing protein n=1 Tax=Alicyclobacillus fastidiosus TaxID=392011 RepID=A0ABV5AD50_9BACL|nr:2Fe-2S iron-sulfur cluster binding domain-containing protein [Alicyclobacillus fastidiosus]WEH11507.1 2Fe-2S iron-sulfur cluster binding domain-containing protein [Alicyclobacillus fastidiosus]
MYKVTVSRGRLEESSVFSCDGTMSLLDAARNQGVKISYGCRGGGCGMCKIKVDEGQFERGLCSKAVLPDSDRELNYTLACKTFPKSDMMVSLQT